jgi:hypothetical protein
MSAPVIPERLRLAKRAARAVQEKGQLRDTDLIAILGCAPDELRAVVGIMLRWRKVDRCGDYLVAVPSADEGRRSA